MSRIDVIELFAGVGGFRVGLEKASPVFNTVWSNQWEPSTKKQDASNVYVQRFGGAGHCNEDISTVPTKTIPEHDMLVGGFPCQDYSVARTLRQSDGLVGKKGVLWWQIHRILSEKKNKPKLLMLENVDRLLKSPAKQRGRDLAIMLASLSDLGYIVEWRVINAAEHGMPQRRRRVFIMGYLKGTNLHKEAAKTSAYDWLIEKGVMAEALPVTAKGAESSFSIDGDMAQISENFGKGKTKSPFHNAGIIIDRQVSTLETSAVHAGPVMTLGSVLSKGPIPEEYYIDEKALDAWRYLKGAKKEKRTNKASGFEYHYAEGSMVFPDPLDKPSRTIITAEGGAAPSRFKHVIQTNDGRYRRLIPLELERLSMFPDDHTKGASEKKRAFFIGNALVVGIVEKLGGTLARRYHYSSAQKLST